MSPERQRIEIVDRQKAERRLPSEAERLVRIYNLQKALGPEGGEFINELLTHGITPERLRGRLDKAIQIAATRSVFDKDHSEPIVTKKGGKKFLSIPVGGEQVNIEFRHYEPSIDSGDSIMVEKTTFGQRILRKIFKK